MTHPGRCGRDESGRRTSLRGWPIQFSRAVKFTPTQLDGIWIIDPEPHEDERGFFARTWCSREFEAHGLNPALVQCNVSFNRRRGTLRGMHYQGPPHEEAKLVRVTHGAIYDVVVDLRPQSSTALQWLSVELNDKNRRGLYVAEGFAHGFQTLADDTEVLYQMSEFYHLQSARGIRWNDPELNISWPVPEKIVSAKDNSYEDIDASAIRS